MSPNIIPVVSWNTFPAYVRPNARYPLPASPSANSASPPLGLPQQSSHLAEQHANHSHSSCFSAVICLSPKSQSPICCYHTVNSVDIYLFVVDAAAAAFCMEGHSSGMIDYKHAGAQRNIILKCLDWICNNLQVGWFLLFNGIQRKLWFRFLRHNKPCHYIFRPIC